MANSFTEQVFDYPKFHRNPGDPDAPDWRNRPVAPADVVVKKLDTNLIRVKWTAKQGFTNALAILPGEAFWSVRQCLDGIAGSQIGNGNVAAATWADSVMSKSKEIASRPFGNDGDRFSLEYKNESPNIDGVYIQVVAIVSYIYGVPSYPRHVNYALYGPEIPDNVSGVGMTVTKIVGSYPYLEFSLNYTRPAAIKNYVGMHPHVVGYDGGSVAEEVGKMDRWDQTLNQTALYRLPLETGLGNGVAHFTNGSTTVTRVSGSNFAAPWAGRKMIVDNAANSSATVTINTVTPTASLTLTASWTGATGDYTYKTLNNMTWYLVQIGKNGERPGDITTCNSLSI